MFFVDVFFIFLFDVFFQKFRFQEKIPLIPFKFTWKKSWKIKKNLFFHFQNIEIFQKKRTKFRKKIYPIISKLKNLRKNCFDKERKIPLNFHHQISSSSQWSSMEIFSCHFEFVVRKNSTGKKQFLINSSFY